MRNIHNGVCRTEPGDHRTAASRIREGWYMYCYPGFPVDYESNHLTMNYPKTLIIKLEQVKL